jgi:folylpolyglutamate synthase/dihydropteroate synthase
VWERSTRDAGLDATVEAVSDVGRALESAVARATGPVVVAGSLYLVGEARRRWAEDPEVTEA